MSDIDAGLRAIRESPLRGNASLHRRGRRPRRPACRTSAHVGGAIRGSLPTGQPLPSAAGVTRRCHLRLAVPEKRCAHSFACVFRPLRKFRLRFICHWQREAAIPPEGEARRAVGDGAQPMAGPVLSGMGAAWREGHPYAHKGHLAPPLRGTGEAQNPSVTGTSASDTSPCRGGKAHWFAMTGGRLGVEGAAPYGGTCVCTVGPSIARPFVGHRRSLAGDRKGRPYGGRGNPFRQRYPHRPSVRTGAHPRPPEGEARRIGSQ